MNPHFIKF